MIRRASLLDLPELLAIDAACFARPWTEAAWRAELDEGPGSLVLIREGESEGWGFACAPTVVDICELRRIAVLPDRRARGVGRDLLIAVNAHARRAGCAHVELEVAASNVAALALYRSVGFFEVGRRPRYYTVPLDDAVLMTLDLTAANPCSSHE